MGRTIPTGFEGLFPQRRPNFGGPIPQVPTPLPSRPLAAAPLLQVEDDHGLFWALANPGAMHPWLRQESDPRLYRALASPDGAASYTIGQPPVPYGLLRLDNGQWLPPVDIEPRAADAGRWRALLGL